MHLADLDKKIIAHLQGDLPLCRAPYAAVAKEAGISEEELLQKIADYLAAGILRRMGTILRHHLAGFTANAMCGWSVPPERVEEVGRLFAAFPQASHVYQRPTYPDWPYNILTMLHGRTDAELELTAREMSVSARISDYTLLHSMREFKKTSMNYFAG
ncbi:MAG TPA: Lrp/AsnC family transcriptional regulator [Firmicutes bacterium]|nr:Lrp/AsnC family transcriptional regulator [Bacillota bacterium]